MPPPLAQDRAQRKRDSFASLLGDSPSAAQTDSRSPHEGVARVGRAADASGHAHHIDRGGAGKWPKLALVPQRDGGLSLGQPAGAPPPGLDGRPTSRGSKRGRDAPSAPAPSLKKQRARYAPGRAAGPSEATRKAPQGAKPRSRVDRLTAFSAALKM